MCAVTRLCWRNLIGTHSVRDRGWGTVGPRFDVLILVALFDTIIFSMSMTVISWNWLLTGLRLSRILHFSTQESSSDQRGHGFPPGTLPNAIRHRPLRADDSISIYSASKSGAVMTVSIGGGTGIPALVCVYARIASDPAGPRQRYQSTKMNLHFPFRSHREVYARFASQNKWVTW